MKIKLIFVFLLVVFLVMSVSAAEVKNERTLNLSATGISTVEMECGAGALKVEGVADLKQVEVKATLVIKGVDRDEMDEFIKEYVNLSLEKKGDKAVLVSTIDAGFGSWISSLFHSREAYIDMYVRVPVKMDLIVNDGSGSVDISRIHGNVVLNDGSGSIEIQEVSGNLVLVDGSGSTKVESIGGNADITDGSGSLYLKKVGGNVDVTDGSGEMDIFEIKGKVTVNDGSGSILIDGVNTDVEIINAGSGELTIRNVKGRVTK